MLEPILCGPPAWAPLLPKLRGHFAEFLNNASSVGLRILSSSTCVGLRYGYDINNSGFSWHMAHTLPYFSSVRVTSSLYMRVFPPIQLPRLHAAFHSAPVLSTCVPTVLLYRSTGISTCCPSATSFDLALGPDLPRADQLYSGNLGYSAGRIPTFLSLLIPAFSLPGTPQLLPVLLRRASNAPLPILADSSASVSCFSPGHFRRRTSRPVSYYALFECMAASEPTSWLSSKSHILFHLTRTWGP